MFTVWLKKILAIPPPILKIFVMNLILLKPSEIFILCYC